MGQSQQELLTIKSKTAMALRSNGFSKSMKCGAYKYGRKATTIKEGYVFDTFYHPDYQKEVVSLSYYPYDSAKLLAMYRVLTKKGFPESFHLEEFQILIIPSDTVTQLTLKIDNRNEFAV